MAEVVLGIGSSRSPHDGPAARDVARAWRARQAEHAHQGPLRRPHQLRGAAGEGPRLRLGPPDPRGHAGEARCRQATRADAGGHHRRGEARRRHHDGRRRGREHQGRQPPRNAGLLRRLLPPHPSSNAAGAPTRWRGCLRRPGATRRATVQHTPPWGCTSSSGSSRPSSTWRRRTCRRRARAWPTASASMLDRMMPGMSGPLCAHHPQRPHAAQPADAQADVRLRPRRAGRRSSVARR